MKVCADNDYAHPIDTRLFAGEALDRPLQYTFNYVKGLVNSHSNECWNCLNINRCNCMEKLLKCAKIQPVINELKNRGLI